MTEKRQCAKKVWHPIGNWGHHVDCKKNATVEEDGRWWCATHAPSLVKSRDEQKRAEWQAKYAQEQAASNRAFQIRNARQAVIDAAKEWLKCEYGDPDEYVVDATLRDAVQELLKLESA